MSPNTNIMSTSTDVVAISTDMDGGNISILIDYAVQEP